jgi:hypothetical protein
MQPPLKKLLDQVRDAIRLDHYAYRTEETYVQCIRRYILLRSKRHPKEMGKAEIEAFLTHPVVEGQVSASTQNQAFSILLFLHGEVFNLEMLSIDAARAKRPQYVPTVLTKEAISKLNWFADRPSSLLPLLSSLTLLLSDRVSKYSSLHQNWEQVKADSRH